MEILIETLQPAECQLIQESSQDGRNVWLSGVFMQGDIRNRNGRIYPLSEIHNAVTSAQKKIVESHGIFGELDHPQTLNINLDRISHVISELSINGQNAVGKARLLNTPMGLIAKELILSEVKLGVSSRGAGNVDKNGGVTGFNFVTVDIVDTPSAPGALPNPVYESLMNDRHGLRALSLSEQLREDPDAQKYLRAEIRKFIDNMTKVNRFK